MFIKDFVLLVIRLVCKYFFKKIIFKKGVRIFICNVFNVLNDFKLKFECFLISYKWDIELTIFCYVN